MPGTPATADALAPLLRLVDDDTPEVRRSVASALDGFDGDVSELLHASSLHPLPHERRLLSEMLAPARRRRLQRDWLVPGEGLRGLDDDWDGFESMLRLLSDFLHDGVTLRQPLGDAIDLLTEEAEEAFAREGAEGICRHLLREGRLTPDSAGELLPEHFDLAAVASGSPSNGLGLGLLVVLVGQRLDSGITAVNLPGAFFCRLEADGGSILVDPGARGRRLDPEDLAHRIRRYPREVRSMAARAATPGELLLRVTEDLATAFAVRGQEEDAGLMENLVDSLTLPF